MSQAESQAETEFIDVDPVDVVIPDRPAMDDEMDITPMIDLTFLLLIFFILTSKMTAEQVPDIPRAKHGSSVTTKACVTIHVQRGNSEAPKVTRGDGTAFSEDPELQAAEIAEYVQTQLAAGGKTEVLIRAAGNVTSGQMKMVKLAVSEVLEEGKMINVAVAETE